MTLFFIKFNEKTKSKKSGQEFEDAILNHKEIGKC